MKRVTQPPRRRKKKKIYSYYHNYCRHGIHYDCNCINMCVYYKTQQSRDGCQLRKALPLKLHLINQSRGRQLLLQIHHQMHPHPVQLQ